MSILWMAGGLASSSPALAISAAATLPLRWALRPASSLKVSNIANDEGPSWIANQVTVPGSASTSGSADFRNSATSFSLPGLASSGTYSATFDIVNSRNGFDVAVIPLCQRQTDSSFRDRGALISGNETMDQAVRAGSSFAARDAAWALLWQRPLVLPGSGAGQWPPSWQRDRPIKRRFGSNDSGLSNFHGRDRPIKHWFSGNDGGLANFHGLPDIGRLPDATRYFF